MLTRLAAGVLPPAADGPSVELLGFLELPWDDADYAVLTDLNEGRVPDSRQADAWLPDGLRAALGLADNARRYARDVLLLNIVLRSRRSTTVLACRRTAEGDPLMPSRLLLACDQDTLIRRVTDFYPDDEAVSEPADLPPTLFNPGGTSRFLVPRPLLDHPLLEQLGATKFRDYLACPYRFYLKHVERLRPVDDRAVEMDAAAFGNLAHEVLAGFARSGVADATDPKPIADWCAGELARRSRDRYGPSPHAAVRVQLEWLGQRFAVFASAQAREAQAGWRIVADLVEHRVRHAVTVDGRPFTITGTIDRVDRHAQHGHRVVDYKTRDASDPQKLSPEAVHRRKKTEWVDLQLPLYRTLAASAGIEGAAVGYFNLGRSAATSGLIPADWGSADYASADQARDVVIRSLREQKFWPPRQ
ncbi:MAG: PD-(D/E)XK nuclease family protein, partial [Planctomycetota bacterium]